MADTLEVQKTAMRDGDIYRWRWKDEARDSDRGPYRSYHCKSQVAIVKGGSLYDTYWSYGGSDGWLNPDDIILTFWANMADLTEINSGLAVYYRRDDVVDMRHANSTRGPVYLKAGAARDAAIMLEYIASKIKDRKSDIRFAEYALERLAEAEAKVAAGNLDDVWI